ncbi:MAG: hypothetical protein C0618_11095 [Desulfuromonas sp.]|nr:MAG: hypothetical protein C0618_11095 [Desulfuromonas sp.]
MLKRAIFLLAVFLIFPFVSMSMDAPQQERFDQILKMKMAQLTEATEELLEKNYPDHDWDQYDFPDYVFISDSVEMGYKIAVVSPGLLGKINTESSEQGIPCYCFCDAMGHRDLLACFLKDGKINNGYDDHGSACNICYGQAMLAFLWQDAGASHGEILEGMKVKFKRLHEMREKGS